MIAVHLAKKFGIKSMLIRCRDLLKSKQELDCVFYINCCPQWNIFCVKTY